MNIQTLKNSLTLAAKASLIDEIRFIDADDFGDDILGDASKFAEHQPRRQFSDAQSIIVVTTYIGAFTTPDDEFHARTSRLSLSGYYANIVDPLFPMARVLTDNAYKAFVLGAADSDISIPLKAAAVKAGLGWIGKNTLLVSEKYGTFRALGGILTDAPLAETYNRAPVRCGNCTRCIDACPTHAVNTPRKLDRPSCLSDFFETADADVSLLDGIDTQRFFFECDICQSACPFNRRHIERPLSTPFGDTYTNRAEFGALFEIANLERLSEAEYTRDVVPLLGFPLPYTVFRRNLGLITKAGDSNKGKA